ncbi:MAG: hypothetical protein ABI904_02305 [Chloroflexota bacterium]
MYWHEYRTGFHIAQSNGSVRRRATPYRQWKTY